MQRVFLHYLHDRSCNEDKYSLQWTACDITITTTITITFISGKAHMRYKKESTVKKYIQYIKTSTQ